MKGIVRVLSVALLLPAAGCVLAVGNTPDEGGAMGKKVSALEKRVGALEEKCGACAGMECIRLGVMDGKGGTAMMRMGELKMEGKGGKIVLVGPDGKQTEIEIGEGGMIQIEEEGEEDEMGEMEEDEKGEKDGK